MFFMREVDHAMFSLDLVFMRPEYNGSMRSHIRRLSRLTNLAPSAVAALLLIGILTLPAVLLLAILLTMTVITVLWSV
jgi:hypothetical protein